MPLVGVVDNANLGQWWRHEGVRGMVLCVVEEEEVRTVVLMRQILIQLGVDDGWKRSSVAFVGLRNRQRQAEEGGGGGAAPQMQQRQQ
jgi:hypothetical protein